mmetsp:Transcript_15848/g.32579  ORF Transcript_15848/g.32579 Transcript_15848/m.32579 type:complete len:287 (+) Transcript_15848:196-1056(+)
MSLENNVEIDDVDTQIESALLASKEIYESNPNLPRFPCCGTTSKLYCPTCCNILLPPTIPIPRPKLPFSVKVILHDNRAVATGVHLKCMCPMQVDIVDYTKEDIPSYGDGAVLLFPGEGSVSLDELGYKPKTLVVLDCKWTKTVSSTHPSLSSLPLVHLPPTKTPIQSRYWRWHTAGSNMLCTLEAVYFASALFDDAMGREEGDALNSLFFLFGLQRAAIEASKSRPLKEPVGKGYKRKEVNGMPWDKEWKEKMVLERRQEGGVRQKEQRIESKRIKEGKKEEGKK